MQWLGIGCGMAAAIGILGAMRPDSPSGIVPATPLQHGFMPLLGVLLLGPPALTWTRTGLAAAIQGGRSAGAVAISVMAVGGVAFSVPSASPWTDASLAALWGCLVPLVWLTFRGGLAFASTVLLGLALVAGWFTAHGMGPFQADGRGGFLLWSYLASMSLGCMSVHALAGHLHAGEARRRSALQLSGIAVLDWPLPDSVDVETIRRGARLPGEPPELADWLRGVHADDAPRLLRALDALKQGDGGFQLEFRMRAADGGWRWFEGRAIATERDRHDKPTRLTVALTDTTGRKEAQDRERLSVGLFQHLHEGLLITDAEHRVVDVNPTYSQITGLSRKELLGTVPPPLRPAPTGTPMHERQQAMWASLRALGTWRGDVVEESARRDGPRTLQVTISTVLGPDNAVRFHVLVVSDVTEQRRQREHLEQQAHFDPLTRLPNRSRLSQMMADAMAACERDGDLLTVCYLDLDHFKPVNDNFGHAAGDRLLVELARRLDGALRSTPTWSDAAARLGGDEFVLLLRAATLDECKLAVERVLRVIELPYEVEPGVDPVTITASMGAAVYPLDRSDADTLLRHADHAMYDAKQSGRNAYLFFDPERNRRSEERMEAIGRVQQAFDRRQLELHYQPKVDMRTGRVLGVEALIRWNHPESGVVLPAQFLPLIEHTELTPRIGNWVLDEALQQLARWQALGLDLSVSVNVAASHLQEPDFAQRLAERLARHEPPIAHKLELEVLESAALADVDLTSALMERCRSLGVRFALDDFGTGYSTLTYLKRLPVDALKIDRSFVRNMLTDAQDHAIVEGVIGLARTFRCSVVAEGIESAEQARRLIELGCEVGQGDGIATPMRPAAVPDWVRGYRGFVAVSPPQAGAGEDAP